MASSRAPAASAAAPLSRTKTAPALALRSCRDTENNAERGCTAARAGLTSGAAWAAKTLIPSCATRSIPHAVRPHGSSELLAAARGDAVGRLAPLLIVDGAAREAQSNSKILARQLRDPVGGLDRLQFGVDPTLFELVDQNRRGIPIPGDVARRA